MDTYRMWLVTAILLSALARPAGAEPFAAQHLQALDNSHYHRVGSENVGRAFHVHVKLPDSYSDTELSYPVVYVLDGGALFPLMASYYRYLNFAEEIPEAIVVGIGYGAADFAGGNYRSTDYTAPSSEREYWGGAAKFQTFLREELLPLIESNYRARPDRRVIFGQSIAGQFVLFTAQTEPSLFWGHIASNPALHRNLDFFLAERDVEPADARLFVASATGDDPRFREPALRWIEHWSNLASRPWDLEVVHLAGHSHMSAPPASFRQGMIWLFDD